MQNTDFFDIEFYLSLWLLDDFKFDTVSTLSLDEIAAVQFSFFEFDSPDVDSLDAEIGYAELQSCRLTVWSGLA